MFQALVSSPLYLIRDTNWYHQVKYRRFTLPSLSLTVSHFDKASPVLGDQVAELKFHDLQMNQVEICQNGRLFYYLGAPSSLKKHVFVGCFSGESSQSPQVIEGFQLTGLTSATTYDVKKLYRVTSGDPWVFETGNITHDAAGVIFETVSGEFKLLVHDKSMIFNTATLVKRGFMDVFDWGADDLELDCDSCPDFEEGPQISPYDGPIILPQPENTDSPSDEADSEPNPDTETNPDIETESNPPEEATPPQDNPEEFFPKEPSVENGQTGSGDGFCDVNVIAGHNSHNCNVNTNIVEVNVSNNVTNIYSETADPKTPEPQIPSDAEDIPSETFKAAEPDISLTPLNGDYELSGTSLGGCQLGTDNLNSVRPQSWWIQLFGILILFLARLKGEQSDFNSQNISQK